ncbi:MAG: hypothetical protein MHM6MM_001381 [Cercozoa sp. M6MM]
MEGRLQRFKERRARLRSRMSASVRAEVPPFGAIDYELPVQTESPTEEEQETPIDAADAFLESLQLGTRKTRKLPSKKAVTERKPEASSTWCWQSDPAKTKAVFGKVNPFGVQLPPEPEFTGEPVEQTTVSKSCTFSWGSRPSGWQCQECFSQNKNADTKCAACETVRDDRDTTDPTEETPKKPVPSVAAFSFGNSTSTDTASTGAFAWADQASGWRCQECFTQNKDADTKCVACEAVKDGGEDTSPTEEAPQKPVLSFGAFSFGNTRTETGGTEAAFAEVHNNKQSSVQSASQATTLPGTFAWGNTPAGWQCQECFTQNKDADTKCAACESLKEGTEATNLTEEALEKPVLSFGAFSFGNASTAPEASEEEPADSEIETEKKEARAAPVGTFAWGSTPAGWQCQECFTQNKDADTKCAACETVRDGVETTDLTEGTPKKPVLSFGAFSFGNSSTETSGDKTVTQEKASTEAAVPDKIAPASTSTVEKPVLSFGNFAFGSTTAAGTADVSVKSPVEQPFRVATPSGTFAWGSTPAGWQCQQCFSQNKDADTKCAACEACKEREKPEKGTVEELSEPTSLTDKTPQEPVLSPPVAGVFAWASQPSGWQCAECFTQNKTEDTKCAACETHRDGDGACADNDSPAQAPAKPVLSFGAFSFGNTTTETTAFEERKEQMEEAAGAVVSALDDAS